jgi:predicted dehydrogenase
MVRGGLIGCGQIVDEMHMPVWRAIPEVQLKFICDGDADKLRVFARNYDIRTTYVSLKDALAENPGLDFVSIATPGFTHYELCRTAIEAGIHVLVEKPLALSLDEALDLQRRAQKKHVKVCVGHTFRFRDPVLLAKRACEQGRVGAVYQTNVIHHGESLFHASEPPWRWQEQGNKVLLYELAIHLLDLQVYLAGPVRELLAVKTVYDHHLKATTRVYALVEHISGAIGVIDYQAFASSNFTHFEIYGTANDIRIKFFPNYYRLYSGRVNPLDELGYDFLRLWSFVVSSLSGKIRRQAVPRRVLPHYRLFRQFVDSLCDSSVPVPIPIESVVPTMELLERLGAKIYREEHHIGETSSLLEVERQQSGDDLIRMTTSIVAPDFGGSDRAIARVKNGT